MKKGLFALALGTFTLGMAEFIIEGILTDVAHNMNVSIPQVGHLISIYALTFILFANNLLSFSIFPLSLNSLNLWLF